VRPLEADMQIHRAFLQLDELPRGPQVTLHTGAHQGATGE
jgi:hypothetical protein